MTAAQARALAAGWDEFGLDPATGVQGFSDALSGHFPRLLEIGFGMGDALLETAAANPRAACFGVEVYGPGVGHLMQLATAREVRNIRVYRADALTVLEQCIPEAALARVNLFFPDPWPKRRHHKRRLVNAAFLNLVRTRLEVGGVLHLATDWRAYAEQIATLLDGREDFQPTAPLPRPETKYETRGLRFGQTAIDLCFVRRA